MARRCLRLGVAIPMFIATGYASKKEDRSMAQRKPEDRTTVDQILKLVDQLTPEEQDQLVEQMKVQWLRRELGKAEDSLDRGGGKPADDAFDAIIQRLENRKA